MKWPAERPDSNPIENIWGLMEVILRNRIVHPKNHIELFRTRPHIWNSIPSSYFEILVAPMPTCIVSVKKGRDGPTKN